MVLFGDYEDLCKFHFVLQMFITQGYLYQKTHSNLTCSEISSRKIEGKEINFLNSCYDRSLAEQESIEFTS